MVVAGSIRRLESLKSLRTKRKVFSSCLRRISEGRWDIEHAWVETDVVWLVC